MATRRYTAVEKGKSIAHHPMEPTRKRIRAPDFDTSDLIKENALTLIGRVTNARAQPIDSLIASLPRNWTLRGRVTGSGLGKSCFQFRFELEEDMRKVLANRPYSYHHWMVILQKREHVTSPLFPSEIPFWIRLQRLPLHFWHENLPWHIGREIGNLEDFQISKTSAKIRVLMDGLQPLIKEAVIDFDSGEELAVSLDYENLKSHYSSWFRLCHQASDCPFASTARYLDTMEKRRYREELTGATRSSDGSPARPPPQRNDTSQAPL